MSPTPGVSFGLIGEGTNGLGSSSSEPGKGVCVHWFIVARAERSISATRECADFPPCVLGDFYVTKEIASPRPDRECVWLPN